MNGKPFEGDFPGTAEQYVISHMKLREKIFLALILGWAYCGCSHAVDNTVVKETKVDETSKTDTSSTIESGSATERTEGPTTVTETGGWYEVVSAPGADKDVGHPEILVQPKLPGVQSAPRPVQIAPGVFEVYHPPVKVTETGPEDTKTNTWAKGATEAKTDDVRKNDYLLHSEDKSKWNFGLKWYIWVAGIAAIALAGYIFRKSVPFLKWIP